MNLSRSSQCWAPPSVTHLTLGIVLNHGYMLRFVTSSVLPFISSVSTPMLWASFQPSQPLIDPTMMNSAVPWLQSYVSRGIWNFMTGDSTYIVI